MRRWLRPLWVLLALIFLFEAWLWERVAPVIAWVVALIPLPRLKRWLAGCVASLSPAATLLVFVVPFIVIAPVGLLEGWLLAHKRLVAAVAVMVAHKVLGVGLIAFVFDVTRDKLLQMAWFRRLYDLVLDARAWARDMIAPFRRALRQWMAWLRRRASSGFVSRLRRRMHASRSS